MADAIAQLGDFLEKAGGHKYIKRTGTPGHYKYEYETPEGKTREVPSRGASIPHLRAATQQAFQAYKKDPSKIGQLVQAHEKLLDVMWRTDPQSPETHAQRELTNRWKDWAKREAQDKPGDWGDLDEPQKTEGFKEGERVSYQGQLGTVKRTQGDLTMVQFDDSGTTAEGILTERLSSAKSAKKSLDAIAGLGDYLEKAGPYVGPKGGKWADPEHTIPWKEESKKLKTQPAFAPTDKDMTRVIKKIPEGGSVRFKTREWHSGDLSGPARVWLAMMPDLLNVKGAQTIEATKTKTGWSFKVDGEVQEGAVSHDFFERKAHEVGKDSGPEALGRMIAQTAKIGSIRVTKSEAGVSSTALDDLGNYLAKADDGKPGESLGETSTEELQQTHKDLVTRLKAKPDDKAMQARYDAIDAELRRRKVHTEHKPPAHMAEKAAKLPSEATSLTPEKARQMLHERSGGHGRPITEQQRKFFGAIGGHLPAPGAKKGGLETLGEYLGKACKPGMARAGKPGEDDEDSKENGKETEKSMTGIEALGAFLEKADTTRTSPQPNAGETSAISGDNAAGAGGLPHTETNFTGRGPEDGQCLEGVGKQHSKSGPAEMPHPASGKPGEKLSDDDVQAESQMKPAGPGEFRGGQQAMQGRWRKSATPTGGSYTAQELEHTAAHDRAVAEARLRKGEADVVVEGNDPPPPAPPDQLEKAVVFRQGDLAVYSNASDLACERVQKGDSFYHGPPPAIDATGSLRKSIQCSNGHAMPAALSSCPSCGVGATLGRNALGEVIPQLLKSGRGLARPHEPDLVLPKGTVTEE